MKRILKFKIDEANRFKLISLEAVTRYCKHTCFSNGLPCTSANQRKCNSFLNSFPLLENSARRGFERTYEVPIGCSTNLERDAMPKLFFHSFSIYNLRYVAIVYRLIDVALIKKIQWSLLILNSKFWPNALWGGRWALKF